MQTSLKDQIKSILYNQYKGKDESVTEIKSSCPYHEDKNPSFNYNHDKNVFNCFACGEKGNGYKLAKKLGIEIENKKDDQSEKAYQFFHDELIQTENGILEYWINRGINLSSIKEGKIGYLKIDGVEVDVFPYFDRAGSFVGFKKSARNKQYRNEKGKNGWNKRGLGNPLYGMQYLKKYDPEKPLILCEGEKDFWILKQAGYQVLGVSGANGFKSEYATLLDGFKVYIIFDNDDGGRKGAKKTYTKINNSLKCDWSTIDIPDNITDINDLYLNFKDNFNNFVDLLLKKAIGKGSDLKNLLKKYSDKNQPVPKEIAKDLDYHDITLPFLDDWLIDLETDNSITWIKNKKGYFENVSPLDQKRRIKSIYPYFSPNKITSIKESINLGAAGIDYFEHTTNSNKIFFKNGTVDLKTGSFKPIDESDIIIDPIMEYNPELGESEKLIKALKDWFPFDVMKGEQEVYTEDDYNNDIEYILELMAYLTLIPHKDYLVWLNCYGRGRNGKSVFIDIIEKIKGAKNCQSVDLSRWNRFTESSFLGKQLVLGRDSSSYVENTSHIKTLTGDDSINVEVKGKTPFEWKHNLKIIIATNELIRSKDKSHAWYSRIVSLPFTQIFKQNPKFKKELTSPEELSKILNTLVKRAVTLEKRGELRELPEICKQQLDEIKKSNDPVFSWWSSSEYTKIQYKISELYDSYKEWHEENTPNQKIIPKNKFGGANGELIRVSSKDYYFWKKNNNGRFIIKDVIKSENDKSDGLKSDPDTSENLANKAKCRGVGLSIKKSVGENKNEKLKNETDKKEKVFSIGHTINSKKSDTSTQIINTNDLEGDGCWTKSDTFENNSDILLDKTVSDFVEKKKLSF